MVQCRRRCAAGARDPVRLLTDVTPDPTAGEVPTPRDRGEWTAATAGRGVRPLGMRIGVGTRRARDLHQDLYPAPLDRPAPRRSSSGLPKSGLLPAPASLLLDVPSADYRRRFILYAWWGGGGGGDCGTIVARSVATFRYPAHGMATTHATKRGCGPQAWPVGQGGPAGRLSLVESSQGGGAFARTVGRRAVRMMSAVKVAGRRRRWRLAPRGVGRAALWSDYTAHPLRHQVAARLPAFDGGGEAAVAAQLALRVPGDVAVAPAPLR